MLDINLFMSSSFWKSILLFNPQAPLIFTQLYFWIFFFVVLIGYTLIYKKIALRNFYLLAISLFFYYKTSQLFVFLLIFSSVSDFFLGKLIFNTKKKWIALLTVSVSIFINLFVLSYFKFAYFFTDVYNEIIQNIGGSEIKIFNHFAYFSNSFFDTSFNVNKILLPVGISFFTFQTISYSVDLYRKKISPIKNLADFTFYVSFFPQLVAGPIVRASEFIPQIYKPYKLTKYEFGTALFFILKGLFKKLFIGDYIAINFIDRVFSNPTMFTGFENLMALYGYSLQIYVDFSGYTDIAIGVAAIMGFKLPQNFNSPYKAKNINEFWKRWHISLSRWLKDYLYIPLGGNKTISLGSIIIGLSIVVFIILLAMKLWVLYLCIFIVVSLVILCFISKKFKHKISTNINLMITMLLGGLWHGASWQFIIWGSLNGVGIMFYKFWKKISPYEKYNNLAINILKILITLNFKTLTRIWFRANDIESSWEIIDQITTNFSASLIPNIISSYSEVFLIMIFGYFLHWFPSKLKEKIKLTFINLPLTLQAIVSVLIIFIIYQSLSSELQPFVYFQF